MLPQSNNSLVKKQEEDQTSEEQTTKNFSLYKDLSHSIFSHKQDPIIDYFKALIEADGKACINSPGLLDLFSQIIFEGRSLQELQTIFKKKELSFDAVCGRVIQKNTAFFMCLDCDKVRKVDSSIACCLCKECFLNSNHKGHKLLISLNRTGNFTSTCDCGDSSIFEPQGFCRTHLPQAINLKSIAQAIGTDIVSRLNNTVSAAFYGLFSLIELLPDIKSKVEVDDDSVATLLQDLSRTIDLVLCDIISFCNSLINEVTSAFIPIIADILQSKLPENYRTLKHNCEEYKKLIYTTVPYRCTCSIGELLMKNIAAFISPSQKTLTQFFINLGKYDDFKSYTCMIFIKNLYFVFYQDSPQYRAASNEVSAFARSHIQFFCSIEHCEQVARQPIIQNIYDLIMDIMEHYEKPNFSFILILWEIKSIVKCFLRPESQTCTIMLHDKNLAVNMLECLVKYAYTHPYPGPIFSEMREGDVDFEFITKSMGAEGIIGVLFKRAIVQMNELNEEEKAQLHSQIIERWRKLFQDYINKQKFKEISFLPVLERAANSLIRGAGLGISKEKVRSFLQAVPGEGSLSKKAESLLQGTLIQIGALRRVYLISNASMEELDFVYFDDNYTLAELDVTSIQMLIPLLDSEKAFSFLVNNWFQYSPDIVEFVLNTGSTAVKLSKESLEGLEDFLNLLVYYMIDEASYVKLKLAKDPRDLKEEIDYGEDLTRVLRKFLISILAIYYWVDVNTIKAILKSLFWECNIESVLVDLALKEEKSTRVRLKEEYYNHMDIFLFSHKQIMQKDVINMLQDDSQKKKLDTVSGVYYEDLPYYCYEVQKTLFEGDLPVFLGRTIAELESDKEILLRPTLRLILMHLQCTKYFEKKGIDTSLLNKNIAHYLNKEIRISLEKIIEKQSLCEYHSCVKKIEALLKGFEPKDSDDRKTEENGEEKQNEENQALKKKQLADQRMKALKEEFLKKQKAFSMTNQSGMDQMRVEEESKNEENIQCNMCLHTINPASELFGSPYYLNFVNLSIQNELDMDSKEEYDFPILHGCGHLFHEKCFQNWTEKTQGPQGNYQKLLHPPDTYCPFCLGLVNGFYQLNREENEEPVVPHNEDSAPNDFHYYKDFDLHGPDDIILRLGMLEEYSICRNPDIFIPKNLESTQKLLDRGLFCLRNMYWLYFNSIDFTNLNQFAKKFKLYAEFLTAVKRQTSDDKYILNKAKNYHSDNSETSHSTSEAFSIMQILYSTLSSRVLSKEKMLEVLISYIRLKLQEHLVLHGSTQSKMLNEKQTVEHISKIIENPNEKVNLINELASLLPRFSVLFAMGIYQYGYQSESLQFITNLAQSTTDDMTNLCISYLGVDSLSYLLNKVLDVKNHSSDQLEEKINNQSITISKYFSVSNLKGYSIVLPANYQAFIDKYFSQVCMFCDDFPSHGETAICFLCGQVLCIRSCEKKTMGFNFGNLNTHSVEEHCGFGLYLEVYLLRLIFINFPKNMISSKRLVYIDDSGQTISNRINNPFDRTLVTIDYRKFVLSEETVNYINSVTKEFLVPLEFFANARDANTCRLLMDGVL